ncbi:unnamed protein product [Boreogadus saida]
MCVRQEASPDTLVFGNRGNSTGLSCPSLRDSGAGKTMKEEQEDCSPSQRHLSVSEVGVQESPPPPTTTTTTTTHHTIPPGLQPPAPEASVTVGTGQPPHRKGSPWNLDKVSHWELSAPRGAAADQWTKPGPSGGRRTGTIGGQWQDSRGVGN